MNKLGMNRERSFGILRTVVALLIAFAAAFLIIALVSETPLESIRIFAVGPFTQGRYLGNIVEHAIPLIFSGLAMSVLFQTSLFNMGAEGIFYISGALISLLAIFVPMPVGIHPLAVILMGACVGVLVMLIPGFLRAKLNASELVTSLMLNNILFGVGMYLLSQVLRDPHVGSQMSYKFLETALLPRIVPGTRIHFGLVIALVCVALVYLFLYKTKWGYEIRMTGINTHFANYSGINTFKAILVAHVVAGALAGNHPVGVVGSALFVAYLRIGADMVSRLSDVPTEMVAILQCIILLLVSAEKFLSRYRQKWIEKGVKQYG